MLDNIKSNSIIKNCVQHKGTVKQSNFRTSSKVHYKGLKEDSFSSDNKKNKKVTKFGRILSALCSAILALFSAFKSKFSSKKQCSNKSNKFSDDANTVKSNASSSALIKKEPNVLVKSMEGSAGIEVPQMPLKETTQKKIEQPAMSELVVGQGDIASTKVQDKATSPKLVHDTETIGVGPVLDKGTEGVTPIVEGEIQPQQLAEQVVQSSTSDKVVHDISGGAPSYELTLKLPYSSEKIELILPQNPPWVDNGNIYKELKYEWGEGGYNSSIRDIQIGTMDEEEFQKSMCETLDDIINGNQKRLLKTETLFVLNNTKDANLSDEAIEALHSIVFLKNATINNFNEEIKAEISTFLDSLKIDTIDKYKKAMLTCVDEVYSNIDKNITPLQDTYHCYRGASSGAWWNKAEDGSDSYMKYLAGLKVGDTVTPDYGAMFATEQASYATKYAGKDGVLFHIILPKGAKMQTPSYAEFLLPPMAKFKVISNKQLGKDGFRLIELEYLIDQGTRSM